MDGAEGESVELMVVDRLGQTPPVLPYILPSTSTGWGAGRLHLVETLLFSNDTTTVRKCDGNKPRSIKTKNISLLGFHTCSGIDDERRRARHHHIKFIIIAGCGGGGGGCRFAGQSMELSCWLVRQTLCRSTTGYVNLDK